MVNFLIIKQPMPPTRLQATTRIADLMCLAAILPDQESLALGLCEKISAAQQLTDSLRKKIIIKICKAISALTGLPARCMGVLYCVRLLRDGIPGKIDYRRVKNKINEI